MQIADKARNTMAGKPSPLKAANGFDAWQLKAVQHGFYYHRYGGGEVERMAF